MTSYAEFLAGKALIDPPSGISDPPALGAHLFPFQSDIVRWALRRGRAAIFSDCGYCWLCRSRVEFGNASIQTEDHQAVRYLRRDRLALSISGQGPQALLLEGVRWQGEAQRLYPEVCSLRRVVLPALRGAGPRRPRQAVLLQRMSGSVPCAQPEGLYLPKAWHVPCSSSRRRARAWSQSTTERGRASSGREQAQQRASEPRGVPDAGRSLPLAQRRDDEGRAAQARARAVLDQVSRRMFRRRKSERVVTHNNQQQQKGDAPLCGNRKQSMTKTQK